MQFPRALKTTKFTNFHRPHSVFTDFQGLEKLITFSPNFQRLSKTVRTLYEHSDLFSFTHPLAGKAGFSAVFMYTAYQQVHPLGKVMGLTAQCVALYLTTQATPLGESDWPNSKVCRSISYHLGHAPW